jgi:site-specific recombinase XerD
MTSKSQAVQNFTSWAVTNPLPGRHRRGAAHTISGYIGDIELFANWHKETTGHDLSAETLTSDDIQDYVTYSLTVEKRKPNTILRRFAAIRAYCLYLMQADDRITSDLTTGIRLPKKEISTKRGLRRKERLAVGRALAVPLKETLQGRQRFARDKAIIFTMMYVGVRVEELSNIKMQDITLRERSGSIRVLGKNEKERTAGIPSKARDPLREWIRIRSEMGIEHEHLFTQVKRSLAPLKKRAIQYIVEETGKRAGLSEFKLTAHILRHTAVRVWRKETGDDRITAAQMGHSIATMQRYDAVAESDVMEAASKF